MSKICKSNDIDNSFGIQIHFWLSHSHLSHYLYSQTFQNMLKNIRILKSIFWKKYDKNEDFSLKARNARNLKSMTNSPIFHIGLERSVIPTYFIFWKTNLQIQCFGPDIVSLDFLLPARLVFKKQLFEDTTNVQNLQYEWSRHLLWHSDSSFTFICSSRSLPW